MRKGLPQEGYLHENYHYFHLRDTAGQERDFHYHSFDKLVLMLGGRVDYLVENRCYTLRPWDVLLVKHHAVHKALIDRAEPYERIILYLDRRFFDRVMPGQGLMRSFDTADRDADYLLIPDDEQRGSLRGILTAYEAAAGDERFGAQAMRDTLLIQLLIQIGRMRAGPERDEASCDPLIRAAMDYISEHLAAELTVAAVAEHVHLSRAYLMRQFKAQTGETLHAYVREKRLLHAVRLFREGLSAAEVAEKSGFRDYSTFHRAFRAQFSVSPAEMKELSFKGKEKE